MRAMLRSRVGRMVAVTAISFLVLPLPTPLPTPPLPLPSPSLPAVLPIPTAAAAASPAASPPSIAQPTHAVTQPATAPAPPGDAAHRLPIPFTAIYVSSPFDVTLVVALMALPLLLAMWLLVFGRTLAGASRARDAHIRLRLAADLGLRPRELTSMSTKNLFRLREKAAYDELTGVLRAAAGIGAADREIARARRRHGVLSVAFVDVDGLKEANEGDGRAAGDALLRTLVDLLRRGLREEDVIMRYAGDEFVCVLPETRIKDARARVGEIQLQATRSGVRMAAGFAELEPGDDVVSLFARADRELYDFKARRGEIVQLPQTGTAARRDEPEGDRLTLA